MNIIYLAILVAITFIGPVSVRAENPKGSIYDDVLLTAQGYIFERSIDFLFDSDRCNSKYLRKNVNLLSGGTLISLQLAEVTSPVPARETIYSCLVRYRSNELVPHIPGIVSGLGIGSSNALFGQSVE